MTRPNCEFVSARQTWKGRLLFFLIGRGRRGAKGADVANRGPDGCEKRRQRKRESRAAYGAMAVPCFDEVIRLW